jgi:hypothetical protein
MKGWDKEGRRYMAPKGSEAYIEKNKDKHIIGTAHDTRLDSTQPNVSLSRDTTVSHLDLPRTGDVYYTCHGLCQCINRQRHDAMAGVLGFGIG